MSEEASFKSIPTFDATMAKWPIFYLKFKTMLGSRDLLHIIERDADPVVVGETNTQKIVREEQALNRVKNDNKVRSLFLNKMADEAVNLVGELDSAFKMVEHMKAQFQSSSAALALSRLDKLF
ncbi:MAG TPA: hypothetical protein VN843_34200, partial [Anaerolineales bacterium]|nr:hypothetical protein [Anaerolineales bacterium]